VADDRAQPATVVLGTAERRRQNVTEVAVPAAALADRYGLQFGQPDWLPDLIARYHLTPPPGV
jgi:hypothetical protein